MDRHLGLVEMSEKLGSLQILLANGEVLRWVFGFSCGLFEFHWVFLGGVDSEGGL